MSEPVYRPGPLNWTHHAGYSMAHTPWGTYTANDDCWWFRLEDTRIVANRDLAIAACEADYRERVLRCLIPVESESDEFACNPGPLKRAWSVVVRRVGGEIKSIAVEDGEPPQWTG